MYLPIEVWFVLRHTHIMCWLYMHDFFYLWFCGIYLASCIVQCTSSTTLLFVKYFMLKNKINIKWVDLVVCMGEKEAEYVAKLVSENQDLVSEKSGNFISSGWWQPWLMNSTLVTFFSAFLIRHCNKLRFQNLSNAFIYRNLGYKRLGCKGLSTISDF